MYRVAVVTDSETATGFRLAGVEVREADSASAALAQLKTLLSQDYGLVAVNEDLLKGTEEDLARAMRDRDMPIIVPFPAPKAHIESGQDYIARLVKQHIGFFVKLR